MHSALAVAFEAHRVRWNEGFEPGASDQVMQLPFFPVLPAPSKLPPPIFLAPVHGPPEMITEDKIWHSRNINV